MSPDSTPGGPAKTYTFWSVIATFFFWPTGLAAVFQSGKTYAANQAQQWDLAQAASKEVRKWQNITGGIFIVLFLLSILLQLAIN